MKESVIYQEILLEGLTEGKAQGTAQGEAKATNRIALNMLRSNISIDIISQITGLTLKQIEKLQKTAAKRSQSPKSPRRKRTLKP
jgi:predicted transposase/invertase (TIGR01784 family)